MTAFQAILTTLQGLSHGTGPVNLSSISIFTDVAECFVSLCRLESTQITIAKLMTEIIDLVNTFEAVYKLRWLASLSNAAPKPRPCCAMSCGSMLLTKSTKTPSLSGTVCACLCNIRLFT